MNHPDGLNYYKSGPPEILNLRPEAGIECVEVRKCMANSENEFP